MKDNISEYIEYSKKSICDISSILEKNIEFQDQNLWASNEELTDLVKNIINIYYDKYYLYTGDFNKIKEYITFNNKINRKLSCILMSIIDYYISKNNESIIKEKESSILYLTILIYLSIILYNTKYTNIDTPKKIEKVINNVIDNFQKIRFKKEKDLVTLINKLKDIIIKNNEFNDIINNMMSTESYNSYIKINKNDNYLKVLYEYDIDELDNYDGKDIKIVINKLDMYRRFSSISFDYCYYTAFKLLEKGIDYNILFPIRRDNFTNEQILELLNNKNEKVLSKIKFIVDFEEIRGDYDFVNFNKSNNIDLYIDIKNTFESNNYNMFMDMKNIVVPEDFLSVNEKYIEVWKDMSMNFIIKDMSSKISEKKLLGIK